MRPAGTAMELEQRRKKPFGSCGLKLGYRTPSEFAATASSPVTGRLVKKIIDVDLTDEEKEGIKHIGYDPVQKVYMKRPEFWGVEILASN